MITPAVVTLTPTDAVFPAVSVIVMVALPAPTLVTVNEPAELGVTVAIDGLLLVALNVPV